MEKKTIKIKFVDFWSGFNPNFNDFIDALEDNYHVILSDDPEYLFYSCFGYEHLKYDCIRIFYTGECYIPNFNECDYAISFDRMDFGDRFLRVPLYNIFQYRTEYLKLFNRPSFTKDDLEQKKEFCSFVYSNCFAQDIRTQFFEKLSTYKRVNSGGRYRNNIGGAVVDKKEFQGRHKFAIAFENTSHDGYCTEKLMEAFAAGTIPIYYGDPRVSEDFNTNAFINCHEYDSMEKVIEKVKMLDRDDELYMAMRNECPIPLSKQVFENGLKEFLLHIVEQEYSKAYRRPFSIHSVKFEKAQLRHAFFETKIYNIYCKLKNVIGRLRTGTMITSKRTK